MSPSDYATKWSVVREYWSNLVFRYRFSESREPVALGQGKHSTERTEDRRMGFKIRILAGLAWAGMGLA
jgi:hypothetical protein